MGYVHATRSTLLNKKKYLIILVSLTQETGSLIGMLTRGAKGQITPLHMQNN
jgi:hypothetical protein